jgi:hypothetical protein
LETELDNSKLKLRALEAEKNNKMRSVEINTYYGKRYNAHAFLMKTVVFTCIPIIVLSVLYNKGLLPTNIYNFLTGIIIIIGSVIIGLELIDMSNRGSMNWDEYNWYFDKSKAPLPDETITDGSDNTTSNSDPWETPTVTCMGAECCYVGSTYDETTNRCIPNANANATVETFEGLEKHAYTQEKTLPYNNLVKPKIALF